MNEEWLINATLTFLAQWSDIRGTYHRFQKCLWQVSMSCQWNSLLVGTTAWYFPEGAVNDRPKINWTGTYATKLLRSLDRDVKRGYSGRLQLWPRAHKVIFPLLYSSSHPTAGMYLSNAEGGKSLIFATLTLCVRWLSPVVTWYVGNCCRQGEPRCTGTSSIYHMWWQIGGCEIELE